MPLMAIAARRWMDIHSFGDMQEGCKVADLGAGNGIIGLGSFLVGARSSILLEADQMVRNRPKNAKQMGFTDSVRIIQSTLGTDSLDIGSADLIISNPPWGRQSPKADRPFLDAILSSQIISHIMHSAEASHIEPLSRGPGDGPSRDMARRISHPPQSSLITAEGEVRLEPLSGG